MACESRRVRHYATDNGIVEDAVLNVTTKDIL